MRLGRFGFVLKRPQKSTMLKENFKWDVVFGEKCPKLSDVSESQKQSSTDLL